MFCLFTEVRRYFGSRGRSSSSHRHTSATLALNLLPRYAMDFELRNDLLKADQADGTIDFLEKAGCLNRSVFCEWVWPTVAPRNDSPKGSQKNKKYFFEKMSKSKSLFWGRFKSLGGMGVCRKHLKWSQLRACKIWWMSVRKTRFCDHLTFSFFLKKLFGGSRR